MRTLLVLTSLLCLLALVQPSTHPVVAQEKQQPPVKWEYAELTFRGNPGRPGGKDADGKEVEAVASSMTIRWTSGAGDFSVKGWDELAEKLKTPFKKEGTPASQKIQMLNLLGADGWEMIAMQAPTPTTSTVNAGGFGQPGGGFGDRGGPTRVTGTSPAAMMFKRRVP